LTFGSAPIDYFVLKGDVAEVREEARRMAKKRPQQEPDGSSKRTKYSETTHLESGKIRASHILVKHRESRNPSSWRQPKITRTKEEALAIIKGTATLNIFAYCV